jgi:superoxide dismutase
MLGNVAETGSSNIFMVKDGHVFTPAANGTFLSGITRSRTIGLLADYGFKTTEKTLSVREFREADEIFSTGNHSKIVPVTRIEDRDLQPGPIAKRARELYWDWAHSTKQVKRLDNPCVPLPWDAKFPTDREAVFLWTRGVTSMAFELPALSYDYEALQPLHVQGDAGISPRQAPQSLCRQRQQIGLRGGHRRQQCQPGRSGEAVVRQECGLFNNAAQHYNHIHFWKWMKKNGGGNKLPAKLQKAVDSDLGGYDKFKADFIAAGTTQFGSGWAWLSVKNGKLEISRRRTAKTRWCMAARRFSASTYGSTAITSTIAMPPEIPRSFRRQPDQLGLRAGDA